MAEFWHLLATLGITAAGVVAGVWAMMKFAGESLGKFYVEKALATHKDALQYQAETHKSTLRTEEDIIKQALGYLAQRQQAVMKAELDRYSQSLAAEQKLTGEKQLAHMGFANSSEADSRRFRHEVDVAKLNAELQASREDQQAQRAYIDIMRRAGVDLRSKELVAISDKRLPAYQKLWSIMKPLSPRSTEPINEERSRLENDFRNWFFDGGEGLFLTWKALDRYVFATDLLSNPNADDELVRKAFSALRTQMKIDLSVYTQNEAEAQIGEPRQSIVPEGTESARRETADDNEARVAPVGADDPTGVATAVPASPPKHYVEGPGGFMLPAEEVHVAAPLRRGP